MTFCVCRFISIGIEAFEWFETTASGGRGAQRGAVAWAHVSGAESVGEWNGCVASPRALHGRGVLMRAGRLFGAEIRHPGVEKDATVLWCKSAAERQVSACPVPHSSRRNALDNAAFRKWLSP